MKKNLRGKIREFVQSEEGKVGVKSPLTLGAAVGSVLLAKLSLENQPKHMEDSAKKTIIAMAVRSVRVSSRLAMRMSGHVWTRNIVDVDWGTDYPISSTFQRVVVFAVTRSYNLYMMMSFE